MYHFRAWMIYGKKVGEIESLNSYKLHLEVRLKRLAKYLSSPPTVLSDYLSIADLLKIIDKSANPTKYCAEILGCLMLATYLLAKKVNFTFSRSSLALITRSDLS